jgi:hypothetical protein
MALPERVRVAADHRLDRVTGDLCEICIIDTGCAEMAYPRVPELMRPRIHAGRLSRGTPA